MGGFIYDGLSEVRQEHFANRECYEFNELLGAELDDSSCEHCKFYLTLSCKHIDEFMDEEGDVE